MVNFCRYAHENGALWDEEVSAEAANKGQLDCLRYALLDKRKSSLLLSTYFLFLHPPTFCLALTHPIRYVHENGCPWDYSTCMNAAANGSLDCLKYFLSSILLFSSYPHPATLLLSSAFLC